MLRRGFELTRFFTFLAERNAFFGCLSQRLRLRQGVVILRE
jgi:hypothetical protein